MDIEIATVTTEAWESGPLPVTYEVTLESMDLGHWGGVTGRFVCDYF